jgi:hypothetical protein
MIRLAIVFQAVFMAFAATLVAEGLELVALGIGDFMGAMAINADRSARVAPGQQLAVNAPAIGFLDTDVAFAAGFGHVGMVDR